jgi:flagellar protein FliJ
MVMKSGDASSRLKRFDVVEKQRKIAEIEAMIGDFNQMASHLERQIAIEQERAGVSDTNHYAYPTFAKAAMQRRDNLLASAAELEAKLASERETLAAALEELKEIEQLDEGRDAERVKIEQARASKIGAVAGVPHSVRVEGQTAAHRSRATDKGFARSREV